MTESSTPRRIVRFAVFEFDLGTRELRKHGLRIKLHGQPVHVLAMLIEYSGEVVTREELQRRLWPADTYVDFEHSLNAAIKRLRAALGDSADAPRFVETLPRQGYRFIAPLSHPVMTHPLESQLANGVSQSAQELVVDVEGASRAKLVARRSRWWVGIAAALSIGAAAVSWLSRSPQNHQENPLTGAVFTQLTDFAGTQRDASISPDGRFVAFLSDHDGPFDIWLSQVDTGSILNLTAGKAGNVQVPLRSVGFSADGSEIWLGGGPQNRLRLMPLVGGAPHPFLADLAVQPDWSPDGSRLVYQTRDQGDPIFVADHIGSNPRQISVGESREIHQHFPIWSKDGRWVFFVRGRAAVGQMDLWRVARDGTGAERLTFHDGNVTYPVPLDSRTVLYIEADADRRSALWVLNLEQRTTYRVSFGVERYLSVSASADGRRLAASVAHPEASLYTVPLLHRIAEEGDVGRYPTPTVRALAPRFNAQSMFYLSSRGGGDGLWRLTNGKAVEIWRGANGALTAPAAVSPDGTSVAVVLRNDGRARVHILTTDGGVLSDLPGEIEAQGSASWSPDGEWIVIGGSDAKGQGLFKIPSRGGQPVRLVSGQALNPVWSPDGRTIVYAGPDVSTFQPLLAVSPEGKVIKTPAIQVERSGERARFLPDGSGLVYLRGLGVVKDFWLLDMASDRSRQLTQFNELGEIRTFDVTTDGKFIVFDRIRENSNVVLINLPVHHR